MQRRNFLRLASLSAAAMTPAPAQAEPDADAMHLLLDRRLTSSIGNLALRIAPSIAQQDRPCTIDGRTSWTYDNVHASLHRKPDGSYLGWRLETISPDADARNMFAMASNDGIDWKTTSEAIPVEGTVLVDPTDPDPQRRYKMIHHAWSELDAAGKLKRFVTKNQYLTREGGRANTVLKHTIIAATSPDGIHWGNHDVVVSESHLKPGQRWWLVGSPGWAGGDNFPCLLWVPELGEFVTFYRTNIYNGEGHRRERGIGRSDSLDFKTWGPHSLSLRAAPLWQGAMGYGRQDYYQMQVWRCGGVYLGALSVYYWDEDRVHIELAWSPDTLHWDRVCPGTDLIPHPPLTKNGGGCRYAIARPFNVGDDVRVYYGEDNGKHGDDIRQGPMRLAQFRRDRLAGYGRSSSSAGTLTTKPVRAPQRLLVNASAAKGEVRAALLDESGSPIAGFGLAESEPLRGDSLGHAMTWKGNGDLSKLSGRDVRVQIELRGEAVAYACNVALPAK